MFFMLHMCQRHFDPVNMMIKLPKSSVPRCHLKANSVLEPDIGEAPPSFCENVIFYPECVAIFCLDQTKLLGSRPGQVHGLQGVTLSHMICINQV